MKVIIPVAGAGTKLRPHTYTQPKVLMPLANKNILSVIIDKMIFSGVQDFVFVIGYMGNKIIDFVRENYPEIRASFVYQESREGVAHAIWITKDLIDLKEDILISFGDTICEFDLSQMLQQPHSQIAIKRVDDPRDFGVVELDKNGAVEKVVEKPLMPVSNMAMVGIYWIKETEKLFEILDKYLNSNYHPEDQFHLTYAIQKMIEEGVKFNGFKVKNWFDVGKKEELLETNALLLKKIEDEGISTVNANDFEGTVIIPPVSIGKDCVIKNSIIGPYVSLGDHVNIKSSIIKKSIIASYASLKDVVMKASIIGNDASVRGVSQSLNIGDNTEIDLG